MVICFFFFFSLFFFVCVSLPDPVSAAAWAHIFLFCLACCLLKTIEKGSTTWYYCNWYSFINASQSRCMQMLEPVTRWILNWILRCLSHTHRHGNKTQRNFRFDGEEWRDSVGKIGRFNKPNNSKHVSSNNNQASPHRTRAMHWIHSIRLLACMQFGWRWHMPFQFQI